MTIVLHIIQVIFACMGIGLLCGFAVRSEVGLKRNDI